MKKASSVILLSILVPALWAAQDAPTARRPNDVARLRSEIEKASRSNQARLYAELAQSLVDVANQQFEQGDSTKGQATVQEVLESSIHARDLALSTRNHRKEVEITLRQTQRRLEAVKRSLAASDRPALDEVEKKLADMRQELLDAMFAPPNPKKEAK